MKQIYAVSFVCDNCRRIEYTEKEFDIIFKCVNIGCKFCKGSVLVPLQDPYMYNICPVEEYDTRWTVKELVGNVNVHIRKL